MAYFTSFDVDCKRSRMDIYDDEGTAAKALTGMCYLFSWKFNCLKDEHSVHKVRGNFE